VSTGDLKGIYNQLVLFWPAQHRSIQDTAAQEQNRVKHRLNKIYFYLVQSLVYDRVLFLILVEYAKLHRLKEQNTELGPCIYTIKASMGLPCFYIVSERLSTGGYIQPTDIHPFWWYSRPDPSTDRSVDIQTSTVVLNPAVVACSKGRPKGSKRKGKNSRVTGMYLDSTEV
jgi:hypothetical protein